jgi:hypothetical protein
VLLAAFDEQITVDEHLLDTHGALHDPRATEGYIVECLASPAAISLASNSTRSAAWPVAGALGPAHRSHLRTST